MSWIRKHHLNEALVSRDERLFAWDCLGIHVKWRTCLVILVFMSCVESRNGFAQQRRPVAREQSESSPLRKLDLLQQSVKRKLKTALGVNEVGATDAADSAANVASQPVATQDTVSEINSANQPINQYRDQPRAFSTTDELIPLGQSMEQRRIQSFGHGEVPVGHVVPATEIDWNSDPRPAIQSQYSAQSSVWNQGSPAGDAVLNRTAAGENPPLARGSLLGDSQITATQHALRLIEENGDLKSRLAMMDAENKRLKDRLGETENLLRRSNEAVNAAHEEIEATRISNRELQKRLTESEQMHNRYLLETDRMLQSIREELDDLLVREISAKRN